MKLFFSYLKYRIHAVLFLLVGSVVFAGIFRLYEVPLLPIRYAAVLCGFLLLLLGTVDLIRYVARVKALRIAQKSILTTQEFIPAPANLPEEQYQEMITVLREENRRLSARGAEEFAEMNDYYTMWAHQIKTPISAMYLILQSDEEQHANELLPELMKTEQYVDMVLTYLRTTSESTDFVLKPCSLNKIVRQAVRKFSVLFIRKKIKLDLKGVDKEVLTDEKWLGFVVEQLLSNALKYTPHGTISIYLDERGNLVVADTGIGIAPEDVPRIFEKGFTGYNGRLDKKSTGIGLYLCKKICTRLSHTIIAESEPDKGTRIFIGFDTVDILGE